VLLRIYYLSNLQLISISCRRRETGQPSNWSSAYVEDYRLISLEGPEIRFTVSNGRDLFDFWQKSPIVLGQERDGPFIGPPKLDAGFARENQKTSSRFTIRSKKSEGAKRKDTKVWTRREKGAICITSDPYPHFFRFRRQAQLVIHGEYESKQREGGTEMDFSRSLNIII